MDDREQSSLEKTLERAKQIRYILDEQIPAAERNVRAGENVNLFIEKGRVCIGNLGFQLAIHEPDAALAVSLVVMEKLQKARVRLEEEYRALK